MGAAVATGKRTRTKRVRIARGALFLGIVGALGLLLSPSPASAQIAPAPTESDYCSAKSAPAGRFTAPDPTSNLNITISGPGSVTVARMYGSTANVEECISPRPLTCSTFCTFVVQTVCEFHCQHDHIAPYPWTVELVGIAAANNYLVGWSAAPGGCVPIKAAPRTSCIVRMTTDQNVTAHFAASADTVAPTPPVVTATPQPYAVPLSWSPSTDTSLAGGSWLAGYDIHASPLRVAHVARVTASTTSFRVANLLCQTTYTFRVEAFDWSGNTTSSAPITATTGACTTGGGLLRPNTVIHVKPPKVTRSRRAYFHFGARGETAATKFQCKLNRNRWVRCSGATGKTYRRLARGRYHTFRVRAGNAAGWDPTPARYTWRIRR
jgi:hypothetical protein